MVVNAVVELDWFVRTVAECKEFESGRGLAMERIQFVDEAR
jgi:hypothetical protein